jgi:hypothetical protein
LLFASTLAAFDRNSTGTKRIITHIRAITLREIAARHWPSASALVLNEGCTDRSTTLRGISGVNVLAVQVQQNPSERASQMGEER